jgi:hypothetical protein
MQVGMPSVNPAGRPKGIIHTLSDRRNRFLAELTRGEILALAADKERLDREYKAFDAQVIMGLAETLMDIPDGAEDPSAAREKLYDRELGKAGQKIEVESTAAYLQINVTQQILSVMSLEQLEIIKKQSLLEVNSDDQRTTSDFSEDNSR